MRGLSESEILGPLQREEVRCMTDGSQGPGRERAVGEPEPVIRGGGFRLPGLKHWRLRRELSQRDLA